MRLESLLLLLLLLCPLAATSASIQVADFDGDHKTDISLFRCSNGIWYLQRSSAGYTQVGFGQCGDVAVAGDYDGDGKTDVAVFRASNGTWYIQRSSAGYTQVGFGQSGDVPVPGDYDGDGKTDEAVFRCSNSTWYFQRSTAGYAQATLGHCGDVPVPGDYDGDGKTDVAVFRCSNGTWYLQRSTAGYAQIGFGQCGDVPVPGDYDGDGKTDIAVFRPSNGTWYVQGSRVGYYQFGFGQGGDVPIPTLPSVAVEEFNNGGAGTPISCEQVTPGYIGIYDSGNPGQVTAVATVSTSATAVTFQIYNEQTQSIASAYTVAGTPAQSGVLGYNQYTLSVPSSQFPSVGSYAVTARATDSSGKTASCPLSASAFFAIVNNGVEPPNLNGQGTASCTGSGTWKESPSSGSSIWTLTQSGGSVSGTLTVTDSGCTSLKWAVSGTSNNGVLNLTATNPSPAEDSCGDIAATTVTANNISISGSACDAASGSDTDTFPAGYGTQTFAVSWTASAAVPSGETSTFDQWGPDGYSNQGLFIGHLTTSSGSGQFSGRRVQESFPVDAADGCANADPNGLRPPLHLSGAGSSWNVLSDSTYMDDWIGYGPASTRYFQTYVGSCILRVPQQQMSISGDNNAWIPYKTNVLEYDVTPTQVTVKRDTASQGRTYPK